MLQPLIGVALALVLTFLVYLPILPSVLNTMGEISATSSVDKMQVYQNPIWTMVEGVRTAIGNTGPLTVIVAVAGLVTIAFGALGTHAKQPLFFVTIAMHIVVTLVILMSLDMRIWPRFFFVDIGPVIVLVVVGCGYGAGLVARLFRRPQIARPLFIVGVLVMVAVSLFLVQRNYDAPKQDLAGAFVFVEETRGPSERVYAINPGGPVFESHFDADWTTIGDAEGYAKAMEQPGPVALVVLFPNRMLRVIPGLGTDIDKELELERAFAGTLGDGHVLVYRRK